VTATTGNIGTVNATNLSSTTLATTGAATVGGTLGVTGATTTNGITNTGNIQTTTLNATSGTITTLNATTGNIATVNATDVNATNVGATTVTATTGNIGTVNATTVNSANIVNSGTTTTGALAVGGGGLSVAPGANLNFGGNRLTNVAAPVSASDAATKGYVDSRLTTASDRINEAFRKIDLNTEGIAIAIAMGGLSLPKNANFAVSANLGFFEDKQAMAFQSALRINDTLVLSGGIGVGASSHHVGGRIGLTASW
jgi:hypothetical protein